MKALILLSGLGVFSLLAEIFNFKKFLLPIVLIGLLATIGVAAFDWDTQIQYYNNMMVFDNFAISFTILLLITCFGWLLTARSYFVEESSLTDHFALVLFSLFGAMLMVSYNNMTMLFLGIETLSLPLYVMAGSQKSNLSSNEAAFKYFLLGSFATGFILFGIALIYGTTASFHLEGIAKYVASVNGNVSGIFVTGLLMMLCGLCFKVGAAPFHFWTPDVYEGSPTQVTSFMATIVKTAAFAAFFRLFHVCFSSVYGSWADVISVICVLTLFIGNVTAVFQTSVKRLLAYSSIAHAGYLLLGILGVSALAANSILYYSLAYSIATICAFAILHIIQQAKKTDTIDNFNGLFKSNPVMAVAMAISMLSLAGIPPTAGFFGKYLLFTTALQKGHNWLVILAVMSSLIGVYYYFKIIIAMFYKKSNAPESILITPAQSAIIVVLCILSIAVGIVPGLFTGIL